MRPDGINRIINYLDVIASKNGDMPIEIKANLIDNISAVFGTNSISSINIAVVDFNEDVDSRTWPVYVTYTRWRGGFSIILTKQGLKEYSAKELVALMVHHITQAYSTKVANTRAVSAFYHIMENEAKVMYSEQELFTELLLDISTRPFANFYIESPETTFISGDEILRDYGLIEAYNSAIYKFHGISKDLWSAMSVKDFDEFNKKVIQDAIDGDIKFAKLFKRLIKDDSVNEYLKSRAIRCPWLTVANDNSTMVQLGLLTNNRVDDGCSNANVTAVNESICLNEAFSGKTRVDHSELRYQMDRAIVMANYIDTEDERVAVLMKIKRLTDKLNETDAALSKDVERAVDKDAPAKQKYIQAMLTELDRLRQTVVEKPMVPKKYSVFIEYPAGYEG